MVLVPEVVACDGGFVTLVDTILPGRGLLGNRSHAWLDTAASFGLEYERVLGPAGNLKDEAGWLGVNWLRGLRSTQEAVVRPSRACRSPRCHRRGDRTRPRVGPAPFRSQVRAFLLRMIAVHPVGRATRPSPFRHPLGGMTGSRSRMQGERRPLGVRIKDHSLGEPPGLTLARSSP